MAAGQSKRSGVINFAKCGPEASKNGTDLLEHGVAMVRSTFSRIFRSMSVSGLNLNISVWSK